MSKGSKQRPTNRDTFSSNWDTIFRKEKAVITIPAQHNTKNPPGQIVNPVGEPAQPSQQGKALRQEIDEFLAEKAAKPDNSKYGY